MFEGVIEELRAKSLRDSRDGPGFEARRRRDWRDRLQCPWAVAGPGQTTHRHPNRLEAAARPAGPGRASSRRAELPINAPAPQVWRAPEGPEGTGGLRGAAPNEVRPPSLAGGRALRCPEHPWGHKHPSSAGHTKQPGPQPGNARRSSPSGPCARAGASRPGRSGCEQRCAAPRLRCR